MALRSVDPVFFFNLVDRGRCKETPPSARLVQASSTKKQKFMRIVNLLLCLGFSISMYAQESLKVEIVDDATNRPIRDVMISNKKALLGVSDSTGAARLVLPAGSYDLTFTHPGHKTYDTLVVLNGAIILPVRMVVGHEDLEEVTIVASTRNNQGIENSPMKVEVLGAEELGEEVGLKPGNIASILGDVSGVQIQQSSATSGNSNVRIQGLDGRYTQILRDGMPIYDGFSGGFGILTVPPLDLKQVELIKGSASTLYGGGAIGGLVNLISKRPTFDQSVDALVNYTTLKEVNSNVYLSKRKGKIGYTMFAGYTGQQAVDVNNDGLSDVPDAKSYIVHPRLFIYPSDKTVIAAGYSGAFDDRTGGDMKVLQNQADVTHQYFERNASQRNTGEYIVEHYFPKNVKLELRGVASNFDKTATTNNYSLQGNQLSYYTEASVLVPFGKSDLVAGMNITGDDYNTIAPDTAHLRRYSNFTTGAFAQYSVHIKEKTTVEAGMRTDVHQKYGFFALPRLAVFHRFSEHWASRAGFGMGYKVPNPLVQQNIDYNPLYFLPVNNVVRPERSYGYNAEVNYKKEWAEDVTLFVNQAFYLTQVSQPIRFIPDAGGYIDLVNATRPLVSRGFDLYTKLGIHSWEVYLGYTFTDARYTFLPSGKDFVPLTPKNRGAIVLVKQWQKLWRVGVEGSYNGSQHRYDATLTPDYFFIAIMAQRNIGKHFTVVMNCENLLDYRMSRAESLYTGSISNPTYKPLWAPIDGRIVNLSLRWKL
jgi:outer membrane receptor for ferrienterochelin and colicins